MIRLACLLTVLALPSQADPIEIYTKVANGFAVHMGPIGVEIFALERRAACGEKVDQAEVQALLAREVAARAEIVGTLEGDDLQLAYHYLEGMTLLSQNQRLELVDSLTCFEEELQDFFEDKRLEEEDRQNNAYEFERRTR